MSKWTEEEIQFLKSNYREKTVKAMSKIIDKTCKAIMHKKLYLGLRLTSEEKRQRTVDLGYTKENNPNWKGGISKNHYHYKKLQVERYPERVKARVDVFKALRSGSLVKEVCVVCGDSNVQAHHEDYNKPLDVIWLCPKHHRERHTK